MSEPVKIARQARRVKTETALLDAFEAVLIRDGASDVTVQAIADEAGVAKTLIYKYFDGIEGLIKTWAEQRELFLPLEETVSRPGSLGHAAAHRPDSVCQVTNPEAGAAHAEPSGVCRTVSR